MPKNPEPEPTPCDPDHELPRPIAFSRVFTVTAVTEAFPGGGYIPAMTFPPVLPAMFLRRLDRVRKRIAEALSRTRSRLPALAPAEKTALLAIAAVLAAGGLLRAWERSGVTPGPVSDWNTLRDLIVQSRKDFARGGEGENGGGFPCAVDEIPGSSAGQGGGAENILAAGTGVFKSRGKTASAPGGKKTPPAKPVDLNVAGEKALLTLPGVGPSMVKAILAYRATQGPFRSVDDLLRIKGIGPKKLEALRPHVRIAPPADSTDFP